jgi:hypothetical protein
MVGQVSPAQEVAAWRWAVQKVSEKKGDKRRNHEKSMKSTPKSWI